MNQNKPVKAGKPVKATVYLTVVTPSGWRRLHKRQPIKRGDMFYCNGEWEDVECAGDLVGPGSIYIREVKPRKSR